MFYFRVCKEGIITCVLVVIIIIRRGWCEDVVIIPVERDIVA